MPYFNLAAFMGVCIFFITVAIGYLFFLPRTAVADGGAGETLDSSGRRRERRSLHRLGSREDARISWQTDSEAVARAEGRLVDLHESGAAFRSNLPVSPGTYVYIEIPGIQSATTANVRRCTPAGRRYIVGMEFRGPLFRPAR